MPKGFTHESTHNKSVEWYTPRYIFDALALQFDLDPASPGADIASWIPAKKHLTITDNGLLAKWEGNIWLNPPYGTETPDWLNRLTLHGTGIALLFVRPDTQWFHKYGSMANAICLIKGRIGFVSSEYAEKYANGTFEPCGGCGAASMLLGYGKENARALFDSNLGLTLIKYRET